MVMVIEICVKYLGGRSYGLLIGPSPLIFLAGKPYNTVQLVQCGVRIEKWISAVKLYCIKSISCIIRASNRKRKPNFLFYNTPETGLPGTVYSTRVPTAQ